MNAKTQTKDSPGHPVFECEIYSNPEWGFLAICPVTGSSFASLDPDDALHHLITWAIQQSLMEYAEICRN